MIRLRNLHQGNGNFNGAMVRGTSDIPWSLSNDFPVIDLRNLYANLTTGWTFLRFVMAQSGTAQASGTNYGFRIRAENRVNTSIGTIVAGDFSVNNYNDSASLVLIGANVDVGVRGKSASEVRALDVIADNTTGTGTITTFQGIRVRVVGAGTITNGPYGIRIFNDSESALASAVPLESFIRMESAVATTVCKSAIDATGVRLNNSTGLYSITLTANDNVLFYYKDKDGTAHAVVASDADALAVRS